VTDRAPYEAALSESALSESWGFEWGAHDGTGGFVRLALHRDNRIAWFWAYLLRPGAGPVVVRDHDVTLPRGAALEIRAEALWSELVCETPGEHWSIGLEAFGVALDEADDALHGEIGTRIALGFDFEWETSGDPYTSTHAGITYQEQPGVVHGDVLLGRDRLPLDTVGRFEHTTAPADARDTTKRTTIAWDDGAWWSVRDGSGPRWEGATVQPRESQGLELATQSVAVIPAGDRVVTRSIGAARSEGRTGVGWMETSA
jgi:hypothetical protein